MKQSKRAWLFLNVHRWINHQAERKAERAFYPTRITGLETVNQLQLAHINSACFRYGSLALEVLYQGRWMVARSFFYRLCQDYGWTARKKFHLETHAAYPELTPQLHDRRTSRTRPPGNRGTGSRRKGPAHPSPG